MNKFIVQLLVINAKFPKIIKNENILKEFEKHSNTAVKLK